jgi:hypothetical protein
LKVKPNPLPANSKIIIEFPSGNDIVISDIKNAANSCIVKIDVNVNNTKICTVSTINNIQTVTLTNFNPTTVVQANSKITITIPSVTNSRSLKESESFNIRTQNSDGYNIDKNASILKIINLSIAQIFNLTIKFVNIFIRQISN